jgi:hypothetical protein
VIRIRSTLALREIQVSKAVLGMIREPAEVACDFAPMAFDAEGNLLPG